MTDDNQDKVVTTIVADITKTLPQEIFSAYVSPSGRNPSTDLLKISYSISKLSEEEAIRIIRDVTDSVIFAVLYLIDSNFKNADLATKFIPMSPEGLDRTDLVTLYRSKVDPGGVVVID